jgi:hypothetical protein
MEVAMARLLEKLLLTIAIVLGTLAYIIVRFGYLIFQK